MELIFDLETTGLPTFLGKKRKYDYPDPADLKSYDTARIVSIGWILIDAKSKEIIQQQYHIVKPDGFDIPAESTAIHNITREFANVFGMTLHEIMSYFKAALAKASTVLSYNLDFDFNVLQSELNRYHQDDLSKELQSKRQRCIMLMSQIYMDAPFYPKLSDVYRYVFNAPIQNAHNALGDVLSCHRVYKEIHNKI